MKSLRLGVVVFAACGLGAAAQAQLLTGNLLLRQTAATNPGYVNQVFSDFPTFSTGMGSLVTIAGPAWNISNVQVFAVHGASANTWFGNVTTAVLNVSRQNAGAPDASIDPTSAANAGAAVVYSGSVAVVLDEGIANGTVANQSFRVSANTAGIGALQGLAAGNYVFSLAPNADFGGANGRGQAFTTAATGTATDDYVRNTGAGFGLPTAGNWGTLAAAFGAPAGTQWGIGINGAVPEPATLAVLGIGALALIRRRRSRKA